MAHEATAYMVTSRDDGEGDVYDEAALGDGLFKRKLKVPLLRLALFVTIIAVWEIAGRTVIDPFFISTPLAVATALFNWIIDGTLIQALAFTLQAMIVGFLIGSAIGVLMGLILGRSDLLAKVLDPFILAIYSLPKVALVPLFLLWFGIGITTNTAVAALTVFFLVFYNAYSGARSVDRDLIDVVRLMGSNGRELFRYVIIPSAAVWIFTGLRLAVPYALIGAIVGEIVASDRGIGYLIRQSAGYYNTAGVFAALIILMIVSSALNYFVNVFENQTTRWRPLPG